MKYLIFFVLLLLSGCSKLESFISLESKDIKYIYDGDTFYIYCRSELKCGKNDSLGVRLKNVDTAEIKGECSQEKRLARKAKQFTVDSLRNAQTIILKVSELNKYDRYNRLLANVIVDGEDLGSLLINDSLGRSYSGGKRISWCK